MPRWCYWQCWIIVWYHDLYLFCLFFICSLLRDVISWWCVFAARPTANPRERGSFWESFVVTVTPFLVLEFQVPTHHKLSIAREEATPEHQITEVMIDRFRSSECSHRHQTSSPPSILRRKPHLPSPLCHCIRRYRHTPCPLESNNSLMIRPWDNQDWSSKKRTMTNFNSIRERREHDTCSLNPPKRHLGGIQHVIGEWYLCKKWDNGEYESYASSTSAQKKREEEQILMIWVDDFNSRVLQISHFGDITTELFTFILTW